MHSVLISDFKIAGKLFPVEVLKLFRLANFSVQVTGETP